MQDKIANWQLFTTNGCNSSHGHVLGAPECLFGKGFPCIDAAAQHRPLHSGGAVFEWGASALLAAGGAASWGWRD